MALFIQLETGENYHWLVNKISTVRLHFYIIRCGFSYLRLT